MAGEEDPDPVRIYIVPSDTGGYLAGIQMVPHRSSRGRGVWREDNPAVGWPTVELRRALGQVLFTGEVGERLKKVRESSAHTRIILDVLGVPEVDGLPWEAALPPDDGADWAGAGPVGLWPSVSVVRQSTMYREAHGQGYGDLFDANVRHPLRAYVLDARQVDGHPDLTAAALPKSFESQVVPFTEAPWNRTQKFRGAWFRSCDILHFVGHAYASHLVVPGGTVTREDIPKDLKKRGPRLLILEACSAAGNRHAFRMSLAWEMAQEIPAVLAMLDRIPTDAANVFFEDFYRAIAEGSPVDFAVQRARRKLSETHTCWMLPVLYLNTPGSAVFPTPNADRADTVGEQHPQPLPVIASTEADGTAATHEVVSLRNGLSTTPRLPNPGQVTPRDYTPSVALSAAGDVAVAWGPAELKVWYRDARGFVDSAFPPISDKPPLLAVQSLHGAMLEVVTGDESGALRWIRGRAGNWGEPELLDIGSRVVSAVLLDGEVFVVPSDGEWAESISTDLRSVAGVDAISFGIRDVVALWGVDEFGHCAARVFARVLWRDAKWHPVPLPESMPVPTRLGLRRIHARVLQPVPSVSQTVLLVVHEMGSDRLVPVELALPFTDAGTS